MSNMKQQYKMADQLIKYLRSTTQKLSNSANQKQILQLVTTTYKIVMQEHVPAIVVLHIDKIQGKSMLVTILEIGQKNANLEISDKIQKIYQIGFSCYFSFLGNKNLEGLKGVAIKNDGDLLDAKIKERYEKMRNLLKSFNQIKLKKACYDKGKDIIQFVKTKLITIGQARNYYEQIFFTWMRQELESMQEQVWKSGKIQKYQGQMCCRLHFSSATKEQLVDNLTQVFISQNSKDDIKFQLATSCDTLKKTIVSLLNSSGGMIYFGLSSQNMGQNSQNKGFIFNSESKIKLLKELLKEVVVKIYPPDVEKQEENAKDEQARIVADMQNKMSQIDKETKSQIQLSKYISAQFLPVYNPTTLLYERCQSNQYSLWVVRLKVRAGDPSDVYYFVNEKDNKDTIESFYRDNKNIKKWNLIQYYDRLYQRLKQKANNKVIPQKTETHQLCRFKDK